MELEELERVRDEIEHRLTASGLLDELESYFSVSDMVEAYRYIARLWDIDLDEDEDEDED